MLITQFHTLVSFKMSKLLLILLTFAVGLKSFDTQYCVNDVLLRVRQEYIVYKWNCLQSIDTNFFRIYSSLNSTFFQIIDSYLRPNSLLWACQSFQYLRLNKTTRSRLKNACGVFSSTHTQALPAVQTCLMSFYSGLLGSSSESEKTGQDAFVVVEDAMNALVPLYAAKPTCIGSRLKSFTDSYKSTIETIVNVNIRALNNITKIFANATAASRVASNTITHFRNNLVTCNTTKDADACIKKLVTNCESNFRLASSFLPVKI